MPHHIVYWEMTKRETDVDDAELFDLGSTNVRAALHRIHGRATDAAHLGPHAE